MLHPLALSLVLLLVVLLAVAGPVGVAFLFLRSLDRQVERVLAHIAAHENVGGQPVDLLRQRSELESRKLDFEQAKHKFLLQQAAARDFEE